MQPTYKFEELESRILNEMKDTQQETDLSDSYVWVELDNRSSKIPEYLKPLCEQSVNATLQENYDKTGIVLTPNDIKLCVVLSYNSADHLFELVTYVVGYDVKVDILDRRTDLTAWGYFKQIKTYFYQTVCRVINARVKKAQEELYLDLVTL